VIDKIESDPTQVGHLGWVQVRLHPCQAKFDRINIMLSRIELTLDIDELDS